MAFAIRLARFKALTMGKTSFMGASPVSPLAGHCQSVGIGTARSTDFSAEGVETFDSIESALEALEGEEELMVIGGGQVYRR